MDTADLLARIRVSGGVPRHVAIIMDGNGRWARKRHLPRAMGHRSGMQAVRKAVEGAIEAGVEFLSLFAFSAENWQRPPTEVTALMSLLEEYIQREGDELVEQGVQVHVLGDLARLAPATRAAIADLVRRTAPNARLRLNLFISYGGRAEIVRAVRAIAAAAREGRLAPDEVTEEVIASQLYTHDVPDPDLLIRTSGERRISNFLLWQLAYTELFISKVLWPDFGRQDLYEAILDYQTRERRFGRVTA
jgi:undecaprenyl diphosphate synthase